MKRLVMLAVLCAFVFGTVATASAADIKATGAYTFEFIWKDFSFRDGKEGNTDKFEVAQRLRTKFEFIANENLKGVLYTEVGTSRWGQQQKLGTNITEASSDEGSVEIKAGYIDWNWPGTQQNIKIGQVGVGLPAAVAGSMIQDDESPAVVLSGPITDNVSYMLSWVRADKTNTGNDEYMDLVAAALPLTFDGIKVSPFFAIGYAGDNYTVADARALASGLSTNSTTTNQVDGAWWAGIAFEMTMFDPFVFKADLNYGQLDAKEDASEMQGWYAAASLAYTGWDFMTPEIFFAWTSGEDDSNGSNNKRSNRMPILSNDWALGSFFFGGDWGLLGSVDGEANGAGMGFWTAGISLKDISFFEGLKHTVNVLYIQGTNDSKILNSGYSTTNNPTVVFGQTLLEDDKLIEVDLNSEYSIYDELTAYVELGWIHADWDNDWKNSSKADLSDLKDNAYKISMGLNYKF